MVLSSPRSRGWSRAAGGLVAGLAVVPALAGVVPTPAPPPTRIVSRPRARGGGPSSTSAGASFGSSSPRSRGWSPDREDRRDEHDVVPALAGVVPGRPRRTTGRASRPRARGGGPGFTGLVSWRVMSSPRSRGWSQRRHAPERGRLVVPALAGVVPRSTAGGSARHGRPRARGGGPCRASMVLVAEMSSPRSRGWSSGDHTGGSDPGVVPALAGVVPGPRGSLPSRRCRPRARGGGPSQCRSMGLPSPSSPRSRGWSPDTLRYATPNDVVPALAGVVPRPGTPAATGAGRPRARGGGPNANSGVQPATPSSPRSRGWSPAQRPGRDFDGVVPALAGVVPPSRCRGPGPGRRPRARGGGPAGSAEAPRWVRRPRARGGGPSSGNSIWLLSWSSPRSRGWSRSPPRSMPPILVVPALAGVVPHRTASENTSASRPRARGGGPALIGAAPQLGVSSPRSRGWSLPGYAWDDKAAVVPALAGVVPRPQIHRVGPVGRPRARGGGPTPVRTTHDSCGSSPRSRGWSHPRAHHTRLLRVVPALAGVVPGPRRGHGRCSGRPRARGGGPRS